MTSLEPCHAGRPRVWWFETAAGVSFPCHSERKVIVVKISSCPRSCILVRFVKLSLKSCEMFHLTLSSSLHNQAVGSFHPTSADTAGDTWTEWAVHDWSIMKELCKSLPHTHFHSPSNQFFYSSHCIPLSVSTLFKNHHGLLLSCFAHCLSSILFFLLFYSVLSILYPAFFHWRCSRLTHTCAHTHTHTHTDLFRSGIL